MDEKHGYTLIEIILLISILGILWSFAELEAKELHKNIEQKVKLGKIKLILEDQILYSNLTKEKVTLSYLSSQLTITGHAFIKTIRTKTGLIIHTPDHQLSFYPKQVCSPATVYLEAAITKCFLTLSLRCRVKIQC